MADGTAPAIPATGLRLVEPTVFDVGWLCDRMREDEIAQWCALTGHATYDANLAARSVVATMGSLAFAIVGPDNLPVVVGGFTEDRPGVFQTWMVGTAAGWAQHWRGITKHSRRVMDGLLASGRAHRIQTHALASRRAAHVWYERGLGMTREGVLRSYFADQQDAVVFSKVREEQA